MDTITSHIRNHILLNSGIIKPKKISSLNKLKESEWCQEFETFMRNRLIMGAVRYGCLGAQNKPQYDRCTDMKRRVDLYINDGNLEHLVDIANICLCEFVEGNHPNKHFSAGDDTQHTKRIE